MRAQVLAFVLTGALALGGCGKKADDPQATAVLSPQQIVARQVERLATSAAVHNPFYNPIASPAPVLVTGTLTAGVTVAYAAASAGSLVSSAPFAYWGGTPLIYAGTYVRFPAATISSTDGNTGGGTQGTMWRVAMRTNSPLVSIGVLGGYKYRILVDDTYVSKTTTGVLGVGGLQYLNLDFTNAGGARPRTIQVEGAQAGGFSGVSVAPSYNVWMPPATPKIVFVGDSFSTGAGATFDGNGLVRVAGDYLGVGNIVASGVGGTGYVIAPVNTHNFAQRLSDWTTKSPDIVMFAGGFNDADDTALQPAVLSLLQSTRAALPNAILLVYGVWSGSTGPNAAVLSKENKISAAVTAFNDTNTRFIAMATATDGAWVTGTGYTGAPSGTGNSNLVTSTDRIHPTDYGHSYLGVRIANSSLAALGTF